MSTPGGHRYDYLVDNAVNSGFFAALGLGLRESAWGGGAVALGLWTGAAISLSSSWSEKLERLDGSGRKAYSGACGFDFDDMLYLLAPIVWLEWSARVLVAAGFGVTVMMLLTGWRLRRLIGRRANAGEPSREMAKAQSPLLFTPGPLTTQLGTRRAMLHDWGSREPAFIAMT